MSRTATPTALFLALWATACTSDPEKTGETGETGDSQAATTRGLPEGSSTWSGTMEVGGFTFLLEFALENTGGDLDAVATFSDDPDQPAGMGTATYRLTGTHEPISGLIALAPDDWEGEARADLELLGAIGSYDPDTQTMSGTIADYATGQENSLLGGPYTATLTSGDGVATTEGDLGRALTAGSHTFAGTFQCTTSVREVEGSLDYDGQGGVTGSMTIGDTSVSTPLGDIAFTAVHNPSTGGLTLVPGLWTNSDANTNTFFVDGAYDPSTGVYSGDQRTNTNGCLDDAWSVTVE